MNEYGPSEFTFETQVSRETLARLATYVNLLTEWNERLNLVAPSTIADVWRRHILDSAQIAPLIPPNAMSIVDLGSGAGFPGLVLAIMLAGRPGLTVHLVESTQKKCRFLEAVVAATGAPAQVHACRAEDMRLKADVVTARALAPLERLLSLAHPFFRPDTIALFLKGRSLNDELTLASKSWTLESTPIPSRSDPSGVVLRVTGLTPWRRSPKPS
ncbi:MAG: 16S rRNA (guanine(527)-N(7))-methyltransferase RsmG [Alphaproteobacteria bacterium]|nr:16S rRNA (guanine(527)-N(7))-methyltransferase RsmG [Alphaproteobacteria bacterium]